MSEYVPTDQPQSTVSPGRAIGSLTLALFVLGVVTLVVNSLGRDDLAVKALIALGAIWMAIAFMWHSVWLKCHPREEVD